jgi:hypothetical protein
MKILLVFLLPLISLASPTLTSAKRGFENSRINIFIASNSCDNTGFSRERLISYTKEAVTEYWNDVPTSSLELVVKGTQNDDISADDTTTIMGKVRNNTILIGCNSSGITDFSTAGILAGARLECSGRTCTAFIAINDFPGTSIADLSQSQIIATIAHELGHAFGLGHTAISYNLMYYALGGKKQEFLGQSDIDGVSWLYPQNDNLSGLLGACGTISNINKNDSIPTFFLLFLMGFIFMILLSKYRKIFII